MICVLVSNRPREWQEKKRILHALNVRYSENFGSSLSIGETRDTAFKLLLSRIEDEWLHVVDDDDEFGQEHLDFIQKQHDLGQRDTIYGYNKAVFRDTRRDDWWLYDGSELPFVMGGTLSIHTSLCRRLLEAHGEIYPHVAQGEENILQERAVALGARICGVSAGARWVGCFDAPGQKRTGDRDTRYSQWRKLL